MQKGNQLMIWDCNKQPQQKWGADDKGAVFLGSGAGSQMCMDLAGGNVALGTAVQLWDCNGQWEQQWGIQMGITIRVGQNPKLCLDAAGGGTDHGTALQIWNCNGLAQ